MSDLNKVPSCFEYVLLSNDNLRALKYQNSKDTINENREVSLSETLNKVLIPFRASIIQECAPTLLSCYGTGISPYRSSESSNLSGKIVKRTRRKYKRRCNPSPRGIIKGQLLSTAMLAIGAITIDALTGKNE